jgi:lipopolysaccharide/colanic/teichoic acid biosynthesis glycosyltransferase
MYPAVKRLIDIIVSAVSLIILSPLLILISIALLLTGEHYVFYRQERVGYKNRIFRIFKFATMLKNSPNIGGGDFMVRNDPRVLPLGRFLRKTKINELPQLINILLGDMSLVGPRPLMPVSFSRYSSDMQQIVYRVKPGLTGIASIIFRDEETIVTESKLSLEDVYRKIIMPHKGMLEEWYQKNLSFYTDMMIIFLTAWYIIFPSSSLVYKVFPSLPKLQEPSAVPTLAQ